MRNRVASILAEEYGDRVYSVEDGLVWVSGMNAQCPQVASRMARSLAHAHDIPTGLVHDDDAARFGGVQFRFHDAVDPGAEVAVEWQPIATDGGDVTPRDLVEPTADTLRDRRNAVKSILAGREQPQHVERYLEGYYDALNLAVDEVSQTADRELLGEPICRDPDAHKD